MTKIQIIILSSCLFLLSFSIYLITLSPTVYVEDSGELISAVYNLGVAHPPGYPVYCTLGKFFTVFLPIANIAYRVNLMSAVFASLTVLLLYLLIIRLTVSAERLANTAHRVPHTVHFIAFSIALCFAFSATFWSQAVFSEVYTLNAFFVIFILLLLIGNANLFLSAFIYGLSLANHHTMILLAPIFLVYIIINNKLKAKNRDLLKIENWLFTAGFFISGLFLYIYLPVRSLAKPLINWSNPENMTNFLSHVLRQQYGKLGANVHTIDLFAGQIAAYLKLLSKEFSYIFILIFIICFILIIIKWINNTLKIRKFLFLLFFILFFIFNISFIIILNFTVTPYDINLVKVFFVPSYLMLSVLTALAVYEFVIIFNKNYFTFMILILPVIPFISNYNSNNYSNKYLAYDYGMNILRSMDTKASIFVSSDNQKFTLSYLQTVESQRPDVNIYDETGCVFKNIFGDDFQRLPKNILEERRDRIEKDFIEKVSPLYHALGSNMRNITGAISMPQGLVFQVFDGSKIDKNSININIKNLTNVWKLYNLNSTFNADKGQEYMEREVISQCDMSFGDYYFICGNNDKGLLFYKKASDIAYDIAAVHNNIGIHLAMKGFYDEAVVELQQAILLNPDYALAKKNLEAVNRLRNK